MPAVSITAPSDPNNLVMAADGSAYFAANNKLWKTDGTAAGTVSLFDFGSAANAPTNLYASANGVYFSAGDGSGRELWKTNGTAAGTVRVADLNPGSGSSSPTPVGTFGNTLLFTADNGVSGNELWKTDGTAAGTSLVKDINPGINSSGPWAFEQLNGVLLFTATNPTAGYELWRTDGTTAGTVLVKDINPGPGDSSIESWNWDVVGNTAYFFASDGSSGNELYRTDGTSTGTARVMDLNPGAASAGSSMIVDHDGKLYFSAETPGIGRELWSYDIASDTPALVADLRPGIDSSFPSLLTWVGDTLYVQGINDAGTQIWRSDGTPAGTQILMGGTVSIITQAGGKLYLSNTDAAHGRELWAVDGPADSAHLVQDINIGPVNGIGGATLKTLPFGDKLLFTADDGAHGNELWISDGTSAGTHLVKDLNTTPTIATPTTFTPFKGDFYFTTSAGGLYRASASSNQVERLSSITPASFAAVGDWLYFTTGANTNLPGIWRTDGTAANTMAVQEFPLGTGTGFIRNIFGFNGKTYFSWGPAANSTTLWTTDGTAAGTAPLFDPASPDRPQNPQFYRIAGDKLYFIAQTTGSGYLWVTDGTLAGTRNLGGGAISFLTGTPKVELEANGNSVVYADSDSSLWLGNATDVPVHLKNSDGTYTKVENNAGDFTSSIAVLNGEIYFLTDSGLWKTDGGPGGATLVSPADGDFYPTYSLVRSGDHLLFVDEHAGSNEHDLWVSDGTSAGTRLIKRFYTGVNQSFFEPILGQLVDANGVAYFVAADTQSGIGNELWRTDGTAAGTMPAADLIPGSASSNPTQLTAAGDNLYLMANDSSGPRLWEITPPSIPAAPVGVTAKAISAFRVQLDWTDSNDEESGYRIQRSLTSSFATIDDSFDVPIDSTTFTDPIAIPGTTYWYRVVAFNAAGSAASTSVQVTTPAPAHPTGLKVFPYDTLGNSGWFLWHSQEYSLSMTERTDGDVLEPVSSTLFSWVTPLNDRLYGLNLLNGRGQLLVSDGTPGNTSVVTEFSGRVQKLAAFDGKLYFAEASGPNLSPFDTLYVSDGTAAGTHPIDRATITDTRLQFLVNWIFFTSTGIEKPLDIAWVGGDLYYTASTPQGVELFRTDGVNTWQLTDAANFTPPLNAIPQMLTYLNGYVYFYGGWSSGNNHTRFPLWRTDGTYEGTTPVADIDLGNISNVKLIKPVEANGTIFFGVNKQLWATDGTAAGTRLIANQTINELSVLNGRLYFSTTAQLGVDQGGSPILGNQIWTSDGTAAGTGPVSAMTATQNAFDAPPYSLAPVGASLVFFGDPQSDPSHLPYLFSYTPPAIVLQTPAAPADFHASVDAATQITLTWSDATSIEEGYLLERSLDPDFSTVDFSITLPSNTQHYVDSTLTGGVTYYYRLRAFNTGGDSPLVTLGPVTTQPPIATPTNFHAVEALSGERIDLSWTDNAAGALHYIVQRSSYADFFPASSITLNVTLGPDASSFSDSSVSRFTKYYYRVYAVGADGNSGAAVLTITTGESRPAAPSGLEAAGVSDSGIDVQWVDNAINEGATAGFEVERAVGDGTFSTIATLAANVTSYSDTSLLPGEFYTYRVRAINAIGASAYTATAQARTLPPVLTNQVINFPTVAGGAPHPDFLTTVGNLVYFVYSTLNQGVVPNDAGGTELWVTDGTPGGTSKLYTGKGVRQLINVNGELYFVADNAIWRTGRNVAGVQKVVDHPVAGITDIRLFAALGDELFFATGPNGLGTGLRLWKTDGTAAGTAELVGHSTFFANVANAPTTARVSGKWLYFMDGVNFGDSSNGGNLWRTDGNVTEQITGVGELKAIEAVGDTLYAMGALAGQNKSGLFTVDPDSNAATLVKLFSDHSSEEVIQNLTKVGQKVFFSYAGPNDQGWTVYVSDGTADGTHAVFDPVNDPNTSLGGRAYNIVDLNGEAYILSADPYYSSPGPVGALWKSDGTPEGTQLIRSVTVNASQPLFLTSVDGKVVYSDADRLWRSDGTFEGTVQIDWIGTSSDGQRSTAFAGGSPFAILGDQILFTSPVVGGGRELRLATLVAPAAPDGLVVSDQAAAPAAGPAPAPAGGPLLTWVDHSNSETGFMIERSRTADFATIDATFFTPANATSYVDGSAIPGVRFYYRIRAVNAGGQSDGSNLSALGPPVVLSATFNYGRAPETIRLAFSNDVWQSLSSGWASGAAATLINLTTGQSIGLQQLALTFNQADNSATLSFIPGLFPDGRYQLELHASAIHGASGEALDGNQDGTAGDDFVFDFFQLSGDVDRDGKVSFSDLVAIAQRYGQPASSYSQGDVNGDGVVSFADLVAVAQNYGKSLAPLPQPAGSAEVIAPVAAAGSIKGTAPLPALSAKAPVTMQKPKSAAAPAKAPLPAAKPPPVLSVPYRSADVFSRAPIRRNAVLAAD